MAPRLPTSWARPPQVGIILDLILPFTTRRGVKYGWNTAPPRNKHARFNQPSASPDLPLLSHTPAAALIRKANTLPLRTGALAIKKGMSAMYDVETGKRTPCTVLQLDRVQVVALKTQKKHGYFAVQIGSGWKHPSNVTRPLLGHFAGSHVSPKRYMAEFRVKDERGLLGIGTTIGPEWFLQGQFVDARANCRGMGFEGGMKRHGFKGQGASHGNSLSHRVMGSSGGSQGSGSRVHPGKRMPGNMGGQQVTMQNLEILRVDPEKGMVVVHGCIPGPKGCVVKIQDAIKKSWPDVPVRLTMAEDAISLPVEATA